MATYKLKEDFLLRGWDGKPHAVVNTRTWNTVNVSEAVFQTLQFCNGIFNMDSPILFETHRKIISKMLKEGVIEECQPGDTINDFQKYKKIPCRYMRSAHWSITGRCNYRCRHCYMSAPQAKYGELSTEECMDIVQKISDAGIYKVSLTGGEALVRDDFFEIVDALLDKKIVITQIYSNGALINNELLDKLEERGIKPEFSISFDGVGYHDWMRGVPGAEEAAINAFKLLKKRGYPIGVEMSLHKGNIHTLEETVNFLASLGVSSIKATPTTDSGNWISENGKYTIEIDELYDAYLEYIPKYKKAGAPLDLMLGGFFMGEKGEDTYTIPSKKLNGSDEMKNQPVCSSARYTMYISADGKLLPCIPLTGLPFQEKMPNVVDITLIEAMSDSEYLKAIETKVCDLLNSNEKCNSCDQKLYCGGGCRAGALVSTGNYLGCDAATCHFFTNGYEKKLEEAWNKEDK